MSSASSRSNPTSWSCTERRTICERSSSGPGFRCSCISTPAFRTSPTTIRELGGRIGSAKESGPLADRIEAEIADVRKRVAGRPRPRTLLVFGRDAETLRGIYASGAVGFLHDMLDAAGGTNVFADVKRQSIQTTSELAVARTPDVIIEIGVDTASTSGRNLRAWESLPSIPAVRNKRIYQLRGDGMMNPGPRISASVRRVAEVLHPEAFASK